MTQVEGRGGGKRGRPRTLTEGEVVRMDGYSFRVRAEHRELYQHLTTNMQPGRRRARMLELMLMGLQVEISAGRAHGVGLRPMPAKAQAGSKPTVPHEKEAPAKSIGAIKGFRA